jgi:tetratricopeptide (TPR) repeat protein
MTAELLATAMQHHRAGDFESAEQLYRRILDADPAQADVWNYLGETCLLRGRFNDAIAVYQRAIDLVPKNAAAQNGIGVAYAQMNNWDQAVAFFRQAVATQPDYVEGYSNLGIALSNRGKLAEAERAYREALRIKPAYPEALSNLGLVLASLGRLSEAIACHQQALDIRPDFAPARDNLHRVYVGQDQLSRELANFRMTHWYLSDDAAAYNDLGVALKTQGRLTEAITSFDEALRLQPSFAAAWNNLGITLQERGNMEEAEASLRKAVALNPQEFNALNNLGTVLEALKKTEEAIGLYRESLRFNPSFAEAHNNIGNALSKQGNNADGESHYRRAIELKPDYVQAHHNLAGVQMDRGDLAAALASYDRAIALDPNYAEAHFGRAQARLKMGDFEYGWPEFEWRWWRKEFPPRPFSQPLWDGSSLAGRTILLHAEQGLGDTIHFIRYAPLVKRCTLPPDGRREHQGRVIVECPDSLIPLLASCPGIDQLVAKDSPLPPFDTHAPLLSLPWMLKTTLTSIPADFPYLFADPELVEKWKMEISAAISHVNQGVDTPRSPVQTSRHSPLTTFKIGIAWQGNPAYPNDRRRSIPVERFETLARIDGVRLFSLQKGPGADQLATIGDRFPIVDLGSRFQTFQDTAAALKNLDLAISVDSAVAHCAGALAVPVWVLLPHGCDWRWMLDREDSPWYPTLRLFRQTKPGDWPGVFDRLRAAIAELASRKTSQGDK